MSTPLVVTEAGLSEADLRTIRGMLARTPGRAPSLAEIWRFMDEVWAALGCDERRPDPARLAAFYRHPVWALNGMFAEQDAVSRGHRTAIAAWLRTLAPARVLDFGGGYGGMARMAAAALPGATVEVYEPFPSATALALAAAHPNLRYVAELNRGYDAALCLDVLEHVPDPLPPFAALAGALRSDGQLVIANNFYPVVRCHLPGTFYLRYTFPLFAGLLGLRREGRIPAALADVYRKTADHPPSWPALRALETVSRAAFPALRVAHRAHRALRRRPDAVT